MTIIERPRLKNKGASWWHSADDASPNLSKASMGEFFNVVLSSGAQIGEIWPFNINFPRSLVLVTIYATQEMINEIESKTKFRFVPPPRIGVN